jgi:tight adherence protein B
MGLTPLIAAATFGLIFSIIVGVYWVLIVRPEQQVGSALRGRLKPNQTKKAVLALLRQTERLSDVRGLNAALNRVGGLAAPMQRLITQSGLKITLGTVLLASGCLAGGVYLIVNRLTHLWVLSMGTGALAAMVPFLYVRRARTRRFLKFEEQFPEAIDMLSRALRAGHALTTGLEMVATEVDEPIRSEFRLLYDQQSFGLPLPSALKNFAARVPLLDARFFVTALLTQREAGGNLAEVLDNLAAIIRDRFRVKRQVRVISAHGRFSGWVLAAMPPSLAIAMMFLIPDQYARFYSDPLGIRMIVVAIALQIVGTMIIRKIVNIEY